MTNVEAFIERVVDGVIGREQGYVNHPSDRGGPTKNGITEAVARAHGYTGSMVDLPLGTARAIYRRRYVTGPGFDRVAEISQRIATELADTGVNMGPTVASTWIQRWLTAMNRQGVDYPDLVADGAIGPVTIAALRSYLAHRGSEGEAVLLAALNCSQGQRYLELAEGRQQNEDFIYGWVRARVLEPL